MEEIKIQKTTALLLAGLVLVALFGAYTVFSTPAQTKSGGTVPANAPAPQPQAAKAGGCGCGGGPIASGTTGSGSSAAANVTNAQDIYIRALNTGVYDNMEITVKKGIPVRLHFTADPDAGCGRQLVIYGLDVRAASQNGEENVVDFTPQDAGTYEYSCGMRMWGPGKLVVAS